MHRLFVVVLLCCACFAAPPQKLIVISIDGLDARLLNDADRSKIKIPNILKLARQGAWASAVAGVVPSETWPAHYSLMTGTAPIEHGVRTNDESGVPAPGFFLAESVHMLSLWQAAVSAHLKTALVFWPGTVGANVAFNFPEYWEGNAGHAIDFEPIAAKAYPAGLASRVERLFPSFDKQLWDDASSAQAALYLLQTEKPDVLLVHMSELETEQHDTSAMSVYAREMLENDDEWVGQIAAKAAPGTTIALVSDHGFQNENFLVRPRVMLQAAKLNGKAEVGYGLIGATDNVAADFFRKQIANKRSGIAREVPMEEVWARAPELKRWVAAFDTLPDYVPSAQTKGPAVGPGSHQGVHGFWSSHKDYRSIFILSGEGIRPKKLAEIDLLEIAPTLADVIGVKLPQAKKPSLFPLLSK